MVNLANKAPTFRLLMPQATCFFFLTVLLSFQCVGGAPARKPVLSMSGRVSDEQEDADGATDGKNTSQLALALPVRRTSFSKFDGDSGPSAAVTINPFFTVVTGSGNILTQAMSVTKLGASFGPIVSATLATGPPAWLVAGAVITVAAVVAAAIAVLWKFGWEGFFEWPNARHLNAGSPDNGVSTLFDGIHRYHIWTEELPGRVFSYAYETLGAAKAAFNSWWVSRLLFDVYPLPTFPDYSTFPMVISKGGNILAHGTIRGVANAQYHERHGEVATEILRSAGYDPSYSFTAEELNVYQNLNTHFATMNKISFELCHSFQNLLTESGNYGKARNALATKSYHDFKVECSKV